MKRRTLIKAGGLTGILAAAQAPLIRGAIAQDRYAKYKGQTVVINYPAHPHYDQAEKLFSEFTKETGIKVERDKMQYLRMKDKQVLEMGKPQGDYDIITYVVMWKTEYVAKKLIESLEPYFANKALADPNYDAKDIITAYYENIGLVGGPKMYLPGPGAKLYGLPYGAETGVLGYRRDILEKHNIKPPATYDELLRACRLIKDKEPGMGGLTSRGQSGHQVTAAWLLHLTPHGGEVFDSNFRAAFHQPAALKAAEVYKEIVDTGPPGIPSFGFGEMQNAFLQGQAAFYLDSVSVFGPAQDATRSRVAGRVGYTIHPKAVKHSAQTGGFGMGIPKNAKNKEAAFLLMQWLTSKSQDVKVAMLGGSASRWSTLANIDAVRKYSAEFPVLREALKIANPDWRPLIPEWDDISQRILGLALPDVITGKRSAKDALSAVVPAAEDVVRKAGWLKG
jgi:multiple sugar transport system substrate-binding protein